MIITTTPSIEGRQISQYLGIVFGEVISGVNFARDFAAGLTNFFGGRSGSYEEELTGARETPCGSWEIGRPGSGRTPWWASRWTMRSWVRTTGC